MFATPINYKKRGVTGVTRNTFKENQLEASRREQKYFEQKHKENVRFVGYSIITSNGRYSTEEYELMNKTYTFVVNRHCRTVLVTVPKNKVISIEADYEWIGEHLYER